MKTPLTKAKNLIVGNLKFIQQSDIDEVIKEASLAPKRRLSILLNDSFSEKPQRFVNCLSKSTYVRPHNHVFTKHWELMSWISGAVYVLFFDDNGKVINKVKMHENGVKVIEIPYTIYHCFITLDCAAYLEVRDCKYDPILDRNYAPWAPAENSADADDFMKKLIDDHQLY
jgi:cupin fold WbuC family metalloprotein